MSFIYPQENKKLNIIGHLEELRRRILLSILVLVISAVVCFLKGDVTLALIKRPISPFVKQLIFISPTEAFESFIKISLLAGLATSFPFMVLQTWLFIGPAVAKKNQPRIFLWLVFALVLFYAGIMFSYFVAMPAALKFLLTFSGDIAVAQITLGKYISFFGALILAGAVIFEIPVVIGLLTDAGILNSTILREKRQYAVICILIFAAVITPTQDIFNMLLFALPMILLYEAGVLLSSALDKSRRVSPRSRPPR